MLIRYTPGRTGLAEGLRRAARAVLYLPTVFRLARDPAYPWLNAGAVRWLDRRLTPAMTGFEWGSGRSTLFFASRLGRLTSVEHKAKWRRRVARMVADRRLGNVTLRFVPPSDAAGRPELRPDLWHALGYAPQKPEFNAYADAILDFPEASLDCVCVDGRARVACALNALPRLRPGGILVLDNSEWEKYALIFQAAAGWERLDFENGVWRTTILRRPGTANG
ncbi:MAG: methyltransferase domain containing protein [Solidesulfovibrio sp. DCME]|uniref:methyltransferase domain containing protein n=1 Tax=Solidesulfovibrio sp. DCME TaxID=3447380 RepID=UPI003D0EB73F